MEVSRENEVKLIGKKELPQLETVLTNIDTIS